MSAIAPLSVPHSPARPARRLPACSSTALPDTPDPTARKLHRLSRSPTAPPPAQGFAPRTAPPASPVLLPTRAGNDPPGSRARSTRHSSVVLSHPPLPLLQACAPPAPRTTPSRSAPAHPPLPCHSTPLTVAAVPARSAASTHSSAAPSPRQLHATGSQSAPAAA